MTNSYKTSSSKKLLEDECGIDCNCYQCAMYRQADHDAELDSYIKDELLNI